MAVRGPARGGRSQAEDVGIRGAEGSDGTADWRKLHLEELREIGATCSTYGRGELFMEGLGGEREL